MTTCYDPSVVLQSGLVEAETSRPESILKNRDERSPLDVEAVNRMNETQEKKVVQGSTNVCELIQPRQILFEIFGALQVFTGTIEERRNPDEMKESRPETHDDKKTSRPLSKFRKQKS